MSKKKKSNKRGNHRPLMQKTGSSSTKQSVNPFDVHFNKIKKNVIGRKVLKCEVGRPTKSRHDAVSKRQKTLLKEYLSKDKAGKVLDKRIDEISKRKAKIFELKMKESEMTTLTHGGEFLDEDNLLNDKPKDDAIFDDDNDLNLLKRPDYIESVHFGGHESDSNVRKTKEEFMDEVMGEKRKRQFEHEMNAALTEKLDDEWRDVRLLMNVPSEGKSKTKNDKSIEILQGMIGSNDSRAKGKEETRDDQDSEVNKGYDILMKELIFSSKANKAKAVATSQNVIPGTASSTGPQERMRRSQEEKKAQQEQERHDSQEKRRKTIERIRQNNVVILPLIEPKIEGLTMRRDPHKMLKVKVKRELKGAQRELRKDSAFLKDVWLKETKEKDDERKRKLNKILADIASDVHDVRMCKKSAEV